MSTLETLLKSYQGETVGRLPSQTIFLHLIPGFLIAFVFILLAIYSKAPGYPPSLASLFTWVVAGLPVELRILLQRLPASPHNFETDAGAAHQCLAFLTLSFLDTLGKSSSNYRPAAGRLRSAVEA